MKIKYFILMLAPAMLLASGAESGATDIFARTINFFIFAAILYYLIAEPAKKFYRSRKGDIANRLDSIQVKLRESHGKKDLALQKVEEAKATARLFVEAARKDAVIIREKIALDMHVEIENLDKAFHEKTLVERRKMTRDVVGEVLDEIFKEGSVTLDKDKIVKIVNKKVA